MPTEARTSPSVPREVTLIRLIDAPREQVFKAWIDAKQMAQWWGPRHFTNPVCEVDARPGGAIRIDMQGPDGTVHPMDGVFQEVVAPERLVFTSRAFDAKSNKTLIEALNTVTFTDEGGKTKLTVVARVGELAPEFAAAAAGMEEGWSQSLERLQALVH
jgi:uncharacterized protein YndB with AHSA1/START domain